MWWWSCLEPNPRLLLRHPHFHSSHSILSSSPLLPFVVVDVGQHLASQMHLDDHLLPREEGAPPEVSAQGRRYQPHNLPSLPHLSTPASSSWMRVQPLSSSPPVVVAFQKRERSRRLSSFRSPTLCSSASWARAPAAGSSSGATLRTATDGRPSRSSTSAAPTPRPFAWYPLH